MNQSNKINIFKNLSHSDLSESIKGGKSGIEKECLRVTGSKISEKDFPSAFGSALFNKCITTDFSEALFEFITPPSTDNNLTQQLLDNVHHFVYQNIEGDKLWPFSMPPDINDDNQIRIAEYGKSNLALFKMTYRNGLSYRYGRKMQAIAGVHYNYSFPDRLWNHISEDMKQRDLKNIKSDLYFSCIRNIYRFNWLLLYLFGASPLIAENFVEQDSLSYSLQRHKDFFFLPNATSLRMSDLGYQNSSQSKIKLSLDSLDEYIIDLLKATSKKNDDFSYISKIPSREPLQINANYLQIEDEYYAPCRPKSNITDNSRLLAKLKKGGVDYIEIRSLDLDPFTRTGIDIQTMEFLEAFTIYCAIKDSPHISLNERKEIESNNLIVAREGRDRRIELQSNNKRIKLKDWANNIIDEMLEVMSILEINDKKFRESINDPEQTPSAKYLDMIFESNTGFHEAGLNLADKTASFYQQLSPNENKNWKLLDKYSKESGDKKIRLERDETQTFPEYLERYFSL